MSQKNNPKKKQSDKKRPPVKNLTSIPGTQHNERIIRYNKKGKADRADKQNARRETTPNELNNSWIAYATEHDLDQTSKSAFKKWKITMASPVLASGKTKAWGMTLLQANQTTKHSIDEIQLFKKQLLQQGTLGTIREGANRLGQGFPHTIVHTAVTNVPGAIIAQQVIKDENNVIVETWQTARQQMNPTSVNAQGVNTIGIAIVPTDDIIQQYVKFITDNHQFFGCPVSLITVPQKNDYRQLIDGSYVYDYDTVNNSYGIGEKTILGIPKDENNYNKQNEITSMLDWLTNMPLVLQRPMKLGSPSGNPEPPHTEHVLSILDALWYLNLFETSDKLMMKDYHEFIIYWFFDINKWGNAPRPNDFLTFLQFKHEENEFKSFWPNTDVIDINGAWTKINDFINEYLYANADSNYEKNDDSLIATDSNGRVVFNEPMAQNLAKRIWQNRISLEDGLIDTIFSTSSQKFKIEIKSSKMRNIWERNIISSWRQRLTETCKYINIKQAASVDPLLYGFVAICTYISRLPTTIKEVMVGHIEESVLPLTLTQQGTFLVPTTAMTIMVMQGFSQIIANFILSSTPFKIKYDDFIGFCMSGLSGTRKETLTNIMTLTDTDTERRISTRITNDTVSAVAKYQTITYYTLQKLLDNRPELFNFLQNAFILSYYKYITDVDIITVALSNPDGDGNRREIALATLYKQYEKTEGKRNQIISQAVSQLYTHFCLFFITIADKQKSNKTFTDFANGLKSKLNTVIESKAAQSGDVIFLTFVSNSLVKTSEEYTLLKLYSPLYLHDRVTCDTFFGENLDSSVEEFAKNVEIFNYGESFIQSNQIDATLAAAPLPPSPGHIPQAIYSLSKLSRSESAIKHPNAVDKFYSQQTSDNMSSSPSHVYDSAIDALTQKHDSQSPMSPTLVDPFYNSNMQSPPHSIASSPIRMEYDTYPPPSPPLYPPLPPPLYPPLYPPPPPYGKGGQIMKTRRIKKSKKKRTRNIKKIKFNKNITKDKKIIKRKKTQNIYFS
jgi:hypothetical protein